MLGDVFKLTEAVLWWDSLAISDTNSRITLAAFVVDGFYLPWAKEARRASTSTGHRQIWINHLRDRVGELRLREFRTVDASRMLRALASNVRAGSGWFETIFPTLIAALVWGGIWLRDRRLRTFLLDK